MVKYRILHHFYAMKHRSENAFVFLRKQPGAHVSEAGPAHPEPPSGSIPLPHFYSSTGQPSTSLLSLSPTSQMGTGEARPPAALSDLRGLPQAPLVMLCRGPTPTEIGARGPGSPARDSILGKRRVDDAERRMPKRDRKNEAEASIEVRLCAVWVGSSKPRSPLL